MSEFFRPPPSSGAELALCGDPPRWTGRPQGSPPGEVVNDVMLARSDSAAVYIAYVDAYPEGFEFDVKVITVAAEHEFRREGDEHGPDIFGRHWPMGGGRQDAIPPQLLRIGVQFADGRGATNIIGHDRPADGPVMWPLRGGGGGGRFHQGYWVSPLPRSGPVALVCEWPAAGIPLVRHELDAQLFLDGADRARALFPDGLRVLMDGREWSLGTDADVEWINDGTASGVAITAAIPPIFTSYCTLVPPRNDEAELKQHEEAVIELLAERTEEQPWWLGYLDTGGSDVVFPYAPRATLYAGWEYVLIEAGREQAAVWRKDRVWKGVLPDLMFPADHAWLLSTLWDDDWTCIGGSRELVNAFLAHPDLRHRVREVDASAEDATPPGHTAY